MRLSFSRTIPSAMSTDESLRDHLIYLLNGGGAHLHLQDEIKNFPYGKAGVKIESAPYTAWQLVEHIRIAQWDILEFSRNPKHVSPDWPGGYWPQSEAPPSRAGWTKSVRQIKSDLKRMMDLVADPKTDLHARIPWGDGQTILREALLVADHNAYHLGQLVLLRRMHEASA